MFAFSPTGEHWGIEGSDTMDIEQIREALRLKFKENTDYFEEEKKEIIESRIEEIKKIRGGKRIKT